MARIRVTRRDFLKWAGTTAALGALGQQAGAEEPDPTKVQGRPASEYGTRSPFDAAKRYVPTTPTNLTLTSFTPLERLYGIITPSALHFEVHHAGVPTIDPRRHKLLVHGLVERPRVFTLDELMRFPAISRIAFIECGGNSASEWRIRDPLASAGQLHGLTSCSEWTGVLLATLMREVGVKPDATWMLAEGADAAVMTRSVPIEKAWTDVLVAYGQNGEALRLEQGYPVRLVVPGWEGNVSVKWLRRLKFGDRPWMHREETSGYTDLMPDGTARQFTFVMEAKSVITSPCGGQTLPGPGWYEITGLAWSGYGAIVRVEVSTDGGKSWVPAVLQEPILRFAHVRFRSPWYWDGRETILQSRAIDEAGYVQPTRSQLLALRGEHSVYHYNAIQSWRVAPSGRVTNWHVTDEEPGIQGRSSHGETRSGC